MQTSLRQTIEEGRIDHGRVVVESLGSEFDIMDVAAAAVKQLMDRDGEVHTEEIPALEPGRVKGGKVRASSVGRMTRLFIGGGRKLKIRPGDIVGAITAVTSLEGRQLGSITILDRHSVVDVPADSAEEVIESLSRAPIKGKKLAVRRDQRP